MKKTYLQPSLTLFCVGKQDVLLESPASEDNFGSVDGGWFAN